MSSIKSFSVYKNYLQEHVKSLSDYSGLPTISKNYKYNVDEYESSISIQDQICIAEKNKKLLNKDQLQVYNSIITALQSESPLTKTFFVDGPGGSGKKFLYNTILAKVRSSHKIALAVASSGFAAELLSGGRTAHSRFKIPIPIFKTSTCKILRNSSLALLIQKTSLIVWDEASMIHKLVLECLYIKHYVILQDLPFHLEEK